MKGQKELKHECGYKALAMTIVQMAMRDYEKAIVKLDKNPLDFEALLEHKRTVKFFRSQWYALLCEVPGDAIMEKIQDKVWRVQEMKSKGTAKRGRRTKV